MEKIQFLLTKFLNNLKSEGRSRNTISSYKNDLLLLISCIEESNINLVDLDVNHLQDYLQSKGRYSLSSLRRAQMSCRTFLKFMNQNGLMNDAVLLKSKSPQHVIGDPFIINDKDYKKLIGSLEKNNKDEKNVRDLVIVLMLSECGLKASELANIKWQNIKEVLNVKSKFGFRNIKISKKLDNYLNKLKIIRTSLNIGVSEEDYILYSYLNNSRKIKEPFLDRHGIKFVIYEICNEFLDKSYNSESFRNYAVISWMKKFNNSKTAKLAGYNSLTSLKRFNDYLSNGSNR